MYLSSLRINVANPIARRWLGDLYRVHQRLWMAFPSKERLVHDPFFLGTWDPACGSVPKPRRSHSGFLFRVDPQDGPRILVQSVEPPDWAYAFQNAPYLIQSHRTRTYEPAVRAGDAYRFRLLTNIVARRSVDGGRTRKKPDGAIVPYRKRKEHWVPLEPEPADLPADPPERTRRLSERFEPWREWLRGAGAKGGFDPRDDEESPLLVEPVHAVVRHPSTGRRTRYNAGCFDGILTCTDATALGDALRNGIGPAKAFGFGLLSIAPVQ